jgi:hypothetical protein
MEKPHFYADAPFSPQKSHGRTFKLFADLIHHVRQNAKIIIHDGAVTWLGMEGVVSSVRGVLFNRGYDLKLKLNHLPFAKRDLSTELFLKGELVFHKGRPQLEGQAATQGTVMDWKPIHEESSMTFVLTEEELIIEDSLIFGTITLTGRIQYIDYLGIDAKMVVNAFPLTTINELFVLPLGKRFTGLMNSRIEVQGALANPQLKGEALLQGLEVKQKPIRNIQLQFEGVFPEVEIHGSRLVTEEGVVMQFSDQMLELKDLIRTETYERLIAQTDQEDVVFGEWTLRRKDKDAVLVERDMGDTMRLRFERFEHDEATIRPDETELEVEWEYLLSGSDSFRVRMRDEEEFVGVQKKLSF